ncbi:hypothetical protein COMA2_120157 [Candidatus Nitrospira nitrificans]|uniref:Uncharacterized protein n=1 Tax=Candidatus Nitrospira nitrificans TaxID=1742973 RepID=A0A0S4L664_9BACT|nr:hypothetical protein COMA2_120157 [Candidatus Nitrospira nitrificans]
MVPLDWTDPDGSEVASSNEGLRADDCGGPILPEHAIGRTSVKRPMRPDLILECHVARHPPDGRRAQSRRWRETSYLSLCQRRSTTT